MYIDIAGIPQWIQIETNDIQNPVLLLLHGGPGAPTRFASSAWQPWQRYFTLVHWDQRGSGRTLAENGPERSEPMSFDRIVLDGIAVAEYLRGHLQQQRIFLLGHSWGSAIGVHMVKRRPELFAAFAATGLYVSFQQNEEAKYVRQWKQAQRTCNQVAIAALAEIGPPPYDNPSAIKILREWADKLTDGTGDAPYPAVKPSPGASAEDREHMMRGFTFSSMALSRDFCCVDLPSLGANFSIPIFILMGTHDQQTPIDVAERYFETISAPRKEFVRFQGCHHFVHMNRPEDFLDAMAALFFGEGFRKSS